MTSNEERSALTDLQELLSRDLTRLSDEELFDGIRSAELAYDKAQEWSGRLVREARRREIPWSRLTGATGTPKATLDRRAGMVP